jgi:hypothetical protein
MTDYGIPDVPLAAFCPQEQCYALTESLITQPASSDSLAL